MVIALRRTLLCLAAAAAPGALFGQTRTLAVTPHADAPDMPIRVAVPSPSKQGMAPVLHGPSGAVDVQVERVGGKLLLTWIGRGMQNGRTVRYRLTYRPTAAPAAGEPIRVRRSGGNVAITIGESPFATYDATTGPNKPYLFPLFGPDERQMVRGWPVSPRAGDTTDHPHHRGLWLTHGNVNGEDFWSEGANSAKTIHRAFGPLVSGPVYGKITASTDWISRAGMKLAEDTRTFTFYAIGATRVIDVDVTVRAVVDLTFGDTKEGSFGLRVPDSMKLAGGSGHIENANGVKDGATWGKRSAWVDYYGSIDGGTYGVAILDDPTNAWHPTHWHVRDYGLFAANPFGIHDFERGQPATAGDRKVSAGHALRFRYRVILHRGGPGEARIADWWAATAQPPTVKLQ